MAELDISRAYGLEYEPSTLFVGLDLRMEEIGVPTNRHAITVAGSRSGKGACSIIPNLLRWPHNVLVIDPKGENAEKTWEARQAKGSKVYVLDPYETANVPAHLRASFNPLEGIEPDSLTGSADLEVIADGLVKRSDPKHAQWDDGAVTLLAGIMAYVIAEGAEDVRTLKSVRDILLLDRDELYAEAQDMKKCEAFDGIAQDAGAIIMASFDNEKGMESDFVSSAQRNIKWINHQGMRNVLETSSFKLSDIKTGKASVFVVLPPEYLKTRAGFMRLFVRMAIHAMAQGGSGQGEKCLFILDEFFALGKIDEVATSAGLMPSYGVHLWPFVQDLGQLQELYGQHGWQTFFGNADLHQFFGVSDTATLDYMSKRLGNTSTDEIPLPPAAPSAVGYGVGQGIGGMAGQSKKGLVRATGGLLGGAISMAEKKRLAMEQERYQNEMNTYQRDMAQHGRPRSSPEELGYQLDPKGEATSSLSLNFIKNQPYMLMTCPYFRYSEGDNKQPDETESLEEHTEPKEPSITDPDVIGGILLYIFIGAIVAPAIAIWVFGSALPIIAWNLIGGGVVALGIFLHLKTDIFG